jgi:hypothetical protein
MIRVSEDRIKITQQLFAMSVIIFCLLTVDYVVGGIVFGGHLSGSYLPACIAGVIYGLAATVPFYTHVYNLPKPNWLNSRCVLAALIGFGLFVSALSEGSCSEERAVIVSLHVWTIGLVQILMMVPFYFWQSYGYVKDRTSKKPHSSHKKVKDSSALLDPASRTGGWLKTEI